jgi:hypothetical protein
MTASDGNRVPRPADAEAPTVAGLTTYDRAAPLDPPAAALIAALRAAPEGDVLWTREGDARWIARNAPMAVLLRAGDLLRIPHADFYSQLTLAEEVTRAARGAAIAAAAGGTVDFPDTVKPGSPASGRAAPGALIARAPRTTAPARNAGAR